MLWAYDDVHSYPVKFLSRTRLRGQLSGSGGRGYPADVIVGFTPRSRERPQSVLGGPVGPPSPSTRFWSLAYWMELGAIGEGGTPFSTGLANLRRTVAGSVDRVTSYETRRFPHGHLRKPLEHQGFTQVTTARDRGVSWPLSFRYVSYLTVLTAGERRQDINRVAAA